MSGPLDRIGTVPKVIVVVLGVVVTGLFALGLLALISGSPAATLGAVALAIIVAVPMVIVYAVARIVRNAAAPAIPPAVAPAPPAGPNGGAQSYGFDEQRLYNSDDLR